MAATLDQVLTSLQSTYQPQLDSVAAKQAALPAQYDAQNAGLDATKNDAFDSILSGAQSRGTGVAFGGIPLGEQAKYVASTYLPAKANLLNTQDQQQSSLQDAINTINANKMAAATQQYQFGQTQDLENQKLAEQAREADQTAAIQRASAASNDSLASAFNGFGNTTPTAPTTPTAAKPALDPTQTSAYNFIQSRAKLGTPALVSDFNAALKYYQQTGNNPDYVKLTMYQQMYPNLFGSVKLQPQGQVNTSNYKASF